MKILIICVVSGLFLGACTSRIEPLPDVGLGRSSTTPKHAIRSDRLRNIMREMEMLMFERMYTELALEKELARHAEEFGHAAGELAATAHNIKAVLPGIDLAPENRIVFQALADDLATQANDLARVAAEQQYGAIAAQYERVTHICAGCHSLFRDPRADPTRP